jgi:hypothetical protein
MLTTLALVLAVLWLIGLIAGVGGTAVHLLLVAAVIMLAYDLMMGRRHAHM